MSKSIKTKISAFHDPTLVSLLVINALVIVQAYIFNWNVLTVLWIYWFQSIIIGFFTAVRMFSIKQPYHAGQVTNIPLNFLVKLFFVMFFVMHYGGFHFVYFGFLSIFSISNMQSEIIWPPIYITSLIFFINHLFSYIYHRPEYKKDTDITKIMMSPYNRIIPMHLTIMIIPVSFIFYPIADAIKTNQPIFGHSVQLSSVNQSGLIAFLPLLFFLLLRTYMDAKAHIKAHSDI